MMRYPDLRYYRQISNLIDSYYIRVGADCLDVMLTMTNVSTHYC